MLIYTYSSFYQLKRKSNEGFCELMYSWLSQKYFLKTSAFTTLKYSWFNLVRKTCKSSPSSQKIWIFYINFSRKLLNNLLSITSQKSICFFFSLFRVHRILHFEIQWKLFWFAVMQTLITLIIYSHSVYYKYKIYIQISISIWFMWQKIV